MSSLPQPVQFVVLIIAIVLLFNLIIFVHELGHFLAAKWRGLKIERFQIWFGPAVWKRRIGGVQFGIGCIPAGGYVALPQMAPMGAIEGRSEETGEILPRITPLDKIIVAFAGPLFSLLLALSSALCVWVAGKPKDFIPTQVVGSVEKGSAAEAAGFRIGDRVLSINGKPVSGFAGSLDSVMESIVLSKGDTLTFEVLREGETKPRILVSKFRTPPSEWYQRRSLRHVGIGPQLDHVEVHTVVPNGPAAVAGLQAGDRLVRLDGHEFPNRDLIIAYIKSRGTQPIRWEFLRNGEAREATFAAKAPSQPAGTGPMVGIDFDDVPLQDSTIVHPGPLDQVTEALRHMWTTISIVASPKSSVGIDQLSGPVGIAMMKFQILQMEHPFERLLSFFVLFNVNLAVLNLLPLPVLDGGHILFAILEALTGRPAKARIIEIVQTACALALMGVMLYVTSKDIGDRFGHGSQKAPKIEFSKD